VLEYWLIFGFIDDFGFTAVCGFVAVYVTVTFWGCALIGRIDAASALSRCNSLPAPKVK